MSGRMAELSERMRNFSGRAVTAIANFAAIALLSLFAMVPLQAELVTITSMVTLPDNSFDNRLTAAGSDSGVFIQMNQSDATPDNYATDPDGEGGYRIEIYDASGVLVRRLADSEIFANPTPSDPKIRFEGQGDSVGSDTLPYGSYTMRTYVSLDTPSNVTKIQGQGITIDRPGDLYITSGGVLSWTNTGTRLGFCQVSVGNPHASDPTFLRTVDFFDTATGQAQDDDAYGIVSNSSGDIFVTDNAGTTGLARIMKYSTTTETWSNINWFKSNHSSLTVTIDEWYGLGIDDKDSIYVAGATAVSGGGGGGGFEGVVKIKDHGDSGEMVAAGADLGKDVFDVSPVTDSATGLIYTNNIAQGRVVKLNSDLTSNATNFYDYGGNSRGSIWTATDNTTYITNSTGNKFSKYSAAGAEVYTVTDASQLKGASGIAVWERHQNAQAETYIFIGAATANQIAIYRESANGLSAEFVRLVPDDVYNLNRPQGIAISADSAIFISSSGNKAVKKFTIDGVFQELTAAANGLFIQGTDSTAGLTDSRGFNYPTAIAVDDTGDIYVFDHSDPANPAQLALKKFSAQGAPMGVKKDLDANAGVFFDKPVVQAVWGNGSLYAVTVDDHFQVLKLDAEGQVQSHLGSKNFTDHNADGDLGAIPHAIAISPYYDRSAKRFYPHAAYILVEGGNVQIWTPDLTTQLANYADANPVLPTMDASQTHGFLVDNFGAMYVLDGTAAGGHEFYAYLSERTGHDGYKSAYRVADYPEGTLDGEFTQPRQILWTDNRGVFVKNPSSGKYERKIWIVDRGNDRIVEMLVRWNDSVDSTIIISETQDTPIVVSATVTGDTLISINGTYYVGADTDLTMQINFNHPMHTDSYPAVSFKPNGGSFITIESTAYSASTWSGTFAITTAMDDGEVVIRVENAYDDDDGGYSDVLFPNPDQTDFDPGDDFKSFIIDNSGPEFSLTSPASSGDSTAQNSYTVSGNITAEVTGLDATVQIGVYHTATGDTLSDSRTVTAFPTTGLFSGNINLRTPAPTDNYIGLLITDKVGNRTISTTRRLIQREKAVGTAFVTPSTLAPVGQLNRFVVTYTAAQALANDTIRFTIPTNWTAPQSSLGTSNGYTTANVIGSYVDSTIVGNVITFTGCTIAIGQTLVINYGDSVTSDNGRAKPNLNASLASVDNAFKVELQQAGETGFTGVGPASGKKLAFALSDSNVSATVRETGPLGGGNSQVAKGSDTRILTVRFFNSNTGNHSNKITQLKIEAKSETGASVSWNNFASQVVAKNREEGITFATVTSMPSSNTLLMSPSNFTFDKGNSRDMEIHVTFSTTASIDSVQFYFGDLSDISATDSSSGNAILTYNVDTGLINVKTGFYELVGLIPAETMAFGFTDPGAGVLSTGQQAVTVMKLILENREPAPETPVNPARIDNISLQMRGDNGSTPINGNTILSALRLIDANDGTQYGGVTPGASETMTINLSGFVINSGESRTVRVEVDVQANTTTTSAFRLRLGETHIVTAKDKVTNTTMKIIDPTDLAGVLPFMIDTVTVIPKASASLQSVQFLREDSTAIDGAVGDQLITSEIFYVRVKVKAALNKSAVRVIPGDSDLVLRIDGTDKTSEFTITPPAAATISAGVTKTFDYNVVQNMGSTTGILEVANDTSGGDSRPRAYDDHDYALPNLLRAGWTDTVVDTVSLVPAPQEVTSHGIDTAYASPAETAQLIQKFEIKNNRTSDRLVNSVIVQAISGGTAVILVRLYHDDGDSLLNLGSDSLVATGTTNANDTVRLTLSPKVSLGPNGDTAVLFVAFDFDSLIDDGDTFDARIPVQGIEVLTENSLPSTVINSNGNGVVEIVATRLTMTPDTGINAIGSTPSFTLKAVDAKGNIDKLPNSETTAQYHSVQVDITLTSPDADTTHHITGTSGLANVTPAAAIGVQSINANLSSGQGNVTITDTEVETTAVTLSSLLADSSGEFQFTNQITAAAENLASGDSAASESVAVAVAAVRVVNQSGSADSVTSVSIISLNTYDTDIDSVILFVDANGNGEIDSGTDTMIASGVFTNGLLTIACSVTVENGDSRLFLVGYDIAKTVNDVDVIDARIDTLVVTSSGANLASGFNSAPVRKIDVVAKRLSMNPTSKTDNVGASMTITIKAVDNNGNKDVGYTGGTGIILDLEGSAAFQSTTLVNQDIDPPPDPPYDNSLVKGNFSGGEADVTFLDNTAETIVLSVTAAPGLSGTHDTATLIFNPAAINPGEGSVEPASGDPVVGTLNRYVIEYKALANLAGDTVRFTVPAAWTSPQKTSTTTNGFFLIKTNGTYSDSRVSGKTVTCTGITLANGETIHFIYGDSTASLSGRAGPSANASLADADNVFRIQAYFGVDTDYRSVPAEGGKTLTVSISDSSATAAILDTGARTDTVQIAKGTDTWVLSARFYNSNIGTHHNKLTQIRLNVEADTGGAIDLNKVISNVKVKNTGEGISFADVSTIPSNANMAISLSKFTVAKGLSRDLEIHVTISASATADTVRFYLSDLPSGATVTDSASGNALDVFAYDTGFDSRIKTGGFFIVGNAPAETIAIGYTDPAAGEVATGQKGVDVMKVYFENRNPNHSDTPVNTAKITKLLLQMRGIDGTTAMIPNNVLGKVYVIDDVTFTEYGNVVAPSSGDTLAIDLAGLEIASAESKTVRVRVDFAGDTTTSTQFRLRMGETTLVTTADKISGSAINVVTDSNTPFIVDTVSIVPKAEAVLQAITLLREDSTLIDGANGGQITVGSVFYAALRLKATANRGSARVQPQSTDLKIKIGGVDKTGEFSINAPADFTIAAGNIDTIFYRLVQDSGTTTGVMILHNDTATETRPLVYDAKDYSAPDKLEASWQGASPGTASITTAAIQATVQSLDTTYANPGETAVPVLKFYIVNNQGSDRVFDSLIVDGLSAGTTVKMVRLYHDDGDGLFDKNADSMVDTGILGSSTDTVLLVLDTSVNIGPNGDTALIFVAFDFDTRIDDGDTVDAKIPPQGISIASESAVPSVSSLNSVGQSVVEVVATHLTITPDTQIVAISSSPTITLKAVDEYGNIDKIQNAEADTEGNNLQVQISYSDSDHIDTKFHITNATGMTSVTPTPAIGVQSINGKLSSGQGIITFTDTAAETTIITLSSILVDSSGEIQYASLVSAVAVALSSGDSAAPESVAFQVLKFRITNSSGAIDTLTTVGIQSLNSADTEIDSVILFLDANGNWEIDSGTDTELAAGVFSGGIVSFTGLAVRIEDGDSKMFMLGYDLGASASDGDNVDARADTITMALGSELGSAAINSTPNRKIEITATRIRLSPSSSNAAANAAVSVVVTAVDSNGNIDIDYSGDLGSGQKVQLQVSGNAEIQSSSTFDNEDISPANTVDGNLPSGAATLVFQDATSETVNLTVTSAPGLVGSHDAGVYTIEQGFVVTALDESYEQVLRDSTQRVILRFKIAASGTSDSITQIAITWTGTDTRDVTNVRLYKDQDGSLSFSAAIDTFFNPGGAQSFSNETVTFNTLAGDTLYIPDGNERGFFLVVDVASDATFNDTLDAAIYPGAISTSGGISPLPKGARNSTGWETVTATTGWSVFTKALTDTQFYSSDVGQVLSMVTFTNDGGLRDTLTSIQILDIGNFQAETDITSVTLWGDANNNGTFDTGTDTYIATTTFASGETAAFSISRGINSTVTETYFVVARFKGTMVSIDEDTIMIRYGASSCSTTIFGLIPSSAQTHSDSMALDSEAAAAAADTSYVISADSSNAGHTQGLANGEDSAIVYVVVSTGTGALLSGTTVVLTSSKGSADTIWPASCTTNANGVCTFEVSTKSTTKSKLTVTMGLYKVLNETPTITWLDTQTSVTLGFGASHPETSFFNVSGGAFVMWPTWRSDGRALLYMAKGSIADTWNIFAAFDDGSNGDSTADDGTYMTIKVTGPGHRPYHASRPAWMDVLDASGNRDSDGVADIVFSGRVDASKIPLFAVRANGADTDKNQGSLVSLSDTTINGRWSMPVHPDGSDYIYAIASFEIVRFSYHRDTITGQFKKANAGGVHHLSRINPPFIHNNGAGAEATARWFAFDLAFADTNKAAASFIKFLPAAGRYKEGILTILTNPETAGEAEWTGINDTTVFLAYRAETNVAWNLSWDTSKSLISYCVDNTGNFDWSELHNLDTRPDYAYIGTDFDVMGLYISGTHTTPNKPVALVNNAGTSNDLSLTFSRGDTARVAYVSYNVTADTISLKIVEMDGRTTIDQSGGVLFENGKITAIIDENDVLSGSINIKVQKPVAVPASTTSDSIALTGNAREFFPDGQQFNDSITIILYYDTTDLTAAGLNNNADSEYLLKIYWYDGTGWRDMNAVVDPTDRNGALGSLTFVTNHFSIYAIGYTVAETGTANSGAPGDTLSAVWKAISRLGGDRAIAGETITLTLEVKDSAGQPAQWPTDAVILIDGDTWTGETTVVSVSATSITTRFDTAGEKIITVRDKDSSVSFTLLVIPKPALAETFVLVSGRKGIGQKIYNDDTEVTVILKAVFGDTSGTLMKLVQLPGETVLYWTAPSSFDSPLTYWENRPISVAPGCLEVTVTRNSAVVHRDTVFVLSRAGSFRENPDTSVASVEVVIETGAVDTPVTVAMTRAVAETSYASANALLGGLGRNLVAGSVISLEAEDISGNRISSFAKNIALKFPSAWEAGLRVVFLENGEWKEVDGMLFDTATNTAKVEVNHLSVWGVTAGFTAGPGVESVRVYPNPWRSDGPASGTSHTAYGIKFDLLPAGSVNFRILTITGQLVLEGSLNPSILGATGANGRLQVIDLPTTGRVTRWDLRNQSGKDVASGMYIIILDGPGGQAVRKIAVIR